ncbi:hypothetical protein H0486_11980 [Lachnospiraceae bacterium MD1]|uniref:Uncharacterized protein n=1 Tax=Variimorphobacter saccharofermentans TaxID=2755051 RepID=A0A839K1G9_9FIRM|nr:hypothetical protein [Variimorphobacter saccharofermentans]MBB2183594.1 hypothetical protein [Variimorphobacter saccharofermentans]
MESWFSSGIDFHIVNSKLLGEPTRFQRAVSSLSFAYSKDDEVNRYFAELELLKGVPLSYMVPDTAMLPPESLRIFYLDPNWVTCLLDGGLSIGRHSTQDIEHDNMALPGIRTVSYANSMNVRNLRCNAALTESEPQQVRTGFLLNSQLASGWPGLEVRCYQNGTELQLLRLEHLTDSILLCIVDGEMEEIEFTQPNQSLYFGFNEEGGEIEQDLVSLKEGEVGRSLDQSVPIPFRNKDKDFGVIDIGNLICSILQELGDNQGKYFSAVEFASEMIYKRCRCRIQIKRGKGDGI